MTPIAPTTQPPPPQLPCPYCGASVEEDPLSPPHPGDWRMCIRCERPLRYVYNSKTEDITLRCVSYREFQDAPDAVQRDVFRAIGWLQRVKEGGRY